MKHIDLFSGIGGFSLASEWNGIETIMFCEKDEFCQKVLKKHWPGVPIVEDVNDIEGIKQIVIDTTIARYNRTQQPGLYSTAQKQKIGDYTSDGNSLLLTAGFPCQPFSNAGRKRGADDDRYLWPQTFTVIEAIRPDWIILENVAGILGMVFPDNETKVASQAPLFGNADKEITNYDTIIGRIESNLKQAGYETVWLVIPACSLAAPHRRERVWIVAYFAKNSDNNGNGRRCNGNQGERICSLQTERPDSQFTTDTGSDRHQRERNERHSLGQVGLLHREKPGWTENWYEVATRFCRMDDGVSNRVDRLKSLGNAIVPQVAYEIIKAIKEVEKPEGLNG